MQDEVRILQKVDHPGVIKIHQVFDTPKNLFIILELYVFWSPLLRMTTALTLLLFVCFHHRVTGGDLFDQIVAYGKGYPEQRARELFGQMLQAIAYLHRHNIVHRDLKVWCLLPLKPTRAVDRPF